MSDPTKWWNADTISTDPLALAKRISMDDSQAVIEGWDADQRHHPIYAAVAHGYVEQVAALTAEVTALHEAHGNNVRALLAEVAALTAERDALYRDCTCATSPAMYEGPQEDCPTHGRTLAEALALRDQAREQVAALTAEVERLGASLDRTTNAYLAALAQRDEALARVRVLEGERRDWQGMARIEVRERLGRLRLDLERLRSEVRRLAEEGLDNHGPACQCEEHLYVPCSDHRRYSALAALAPQEDTDGLD